MRRTIIVPLSDPRQDVDQVSEVALPYARLLAGRTGADVVLLSVLDGPPAEVYRELDDWAEPHRAFVCGAYDARRADRERYLRQLAQRFPEQTVQTVVQYGDAADEILHVARRFDGPTIVMAGHGRSGVRRLVLGSVALEVVRGARCPVLLVPVPAGRRAAPAPVALRRVLVAVDDPFLAEGLVDAALGLLGPMEEADVDVCLLEVTEPIPPWPDTVEHEHFAWTREPRTHFLQRVAEELRARGWRATWELRIGAPADEIGRVVDEEGVDLVVMATDGRSGFNRLLFGATGERTAEHRPAPLLLVRPPKETLQRAVEAAKVVRESQLTAP